MLIELEPGNAAVCCMLLGRILFAVLCGASQPECRAACSMAPVGEPAGWNYACIHMQLSNDLLKFVRLRLLLGTQASVITPNGVDFAVLSL